MDRSKETCYKTTKSVFRIYHRLHRRPCKAAKYSACQVSHGLKESRSYKIQVWNITHNASSNTLTYYILIYGFTKYKDNNDCFCKQKYKNLTKFVVLQKKRQRKKCNREAKKHQDKGFFQTFFYTLQTLFINLSS